MTMVSRLVLVLFWPGVLTLASSEPALGARVEIDPAIIRERIESTWLERRPEGASMDIRHIPTLVGEDSCVVEVIWPDRPLRAGPRVLTVGCRAGNRLMSRGLVNVVVRKAIPVWILRRDVSRGTPIDDGVVHLEPRVWDREPTRALRGPMPPGGWVATRDLSAGQWVRTADVRRRPDVIVGDEIQLLARVGEAAVSVSARVRRGGAVGDAILVLNPLTATVVRAVLIDSNTAELAVPTVTTERSET